MHLVIHPLVTHFSVTQSIPSLRTLVTQILLCVLYVRYYTVTHLRILYPTVCPRPRLVEIRRKKRDESQISHFIVHAFSARGRLRWFSFLPAVCLHLGLYVRYGAALDRCGPILARWGPMW